MTCKITLKKEDTDLNESVVYEFDGDKTAGEWLKGYRYFMLACSFTTDTVNNYIPEDIIDG